MKKTKEIEEEKKKVIKLKMKQKNYIQNFQKIIY